MSLLELLINRTRYTPDGADSLRADFHSTGLVRLPDFFASAAFELLRAEILRLAAFRKRRDLAMAASGNSPRRMSTLGGAMIRAQSALVPMLYGDTSLLNFLTGIAGERVLPAPDPNEDMVCNFLHGEGDTQGRHVDTYPFAFNLTIDAPEEGRGGLLEVWPGREDGGETRRFRFQPGECYLLRADKALHCVTLLGAGQRRTVLNFAYANTETAGMNSYSSSILYGHDD